MDRKTILVVDDEENIRLMVRRMLGNEYDVLEAKNGEVAVEMSRRQRPDLILMDIMMPKMDGYTACHTIKRDPATKTIPVVMLSGLGHELNIKLSQEMGADGYITKPFTARALLDKISQFWRSSTPDLSTETSPNHDAATN